jgi:peptide deformylase
VDLRYYPDPVLRARAKRVEAFDQDVADLVGEMLRTIREHNGLGLAAPQVGVSRRVIMVSRDAAPGSEIIMVNPEIVATDGWEIAEEGCLSFPGIYVKIGRFRHVTAQYQDVQGRTHGLEAEGLLARAVQHEVDHLEGRLLVDRMSVVQRMAHRRRLRELERRHARQPARAGAAGTARP